MRSYHKLPVFLLFLFLAMVKLWIPEHAKELRQQLTALSFRETAYVEMVETMGMQLADRGLRDGLISVFRAEQEETDVERVSEEPAVEEEDGESGEEGTEGTDGQ